MGCSRSVLLKCAKSSPSHIRWPDSSTRFTVSAELKIVGTCQNWVVCLGGRCGSDQVAVQDARAGTSAAAQSNPRLDSWCHVCVQGRTRDLLRGGRDLAVTEWQGYKYCVQTVVKGNEKFFPWCPVDLGFWAIGTAPRSLGSRNESKRPKPLGAHTSTGKRKHAN